MIGRAWIAPIAALLAVPAVPAGADDSLPPWAEEARRQSPPPSFASADAVVLLDEYSIDLGSGDRHRETRRRIVRIQNAAGAREAVARAVYRTDGDKVHRLDAWIVTPEGRTRRLRDKEAVDEAVRDIAIYNEARVRSFDATSEARPRAVFAFESSVEYRDLFPQFKWTFQEDIPVCVSRFRLTPPDGWAVAATTVGRDSIAPSVERGVWTWELREVPALEEEPLRPPFRALAASVAVNLVAPEGTSTGERRVIRRWEDASAWLAGRVAARGGADDRLRAKAAALVAGAKDRVDSIRAIAGFTQSVNYVAIEMGLGRGGGYVPRSPREVLATSYGDCKDKANLMRALLESIGVESYLVAIRARGGEYTLRDHPSLAQFDHCILGVRSDDPAEAAVETQRQGRLVLFDPTDPTTPWGSLPAAERGAWALAIAPDGAELLQVPSAPPDSRRRSRAIDATLDAEGSLTASLHAEAGGSAGSDWRGVLRSEGAAKIERERSWWMGGASSGARVDSFGVRETGDGRFLLSARYRIPRFGEPVAGGLMVVDTGRFGTLSIPALADTPRVHPIEIPSDLYEERITLHVPAGYALDEAAEPLKHETAYGTIRCRIREESGVVTIERAMTRRSAVVPAAQYEGVRRFYLEAKRAFRARVVLARR